MKRPLSLLHAFIKSRVHIILKLEIIDGLVLIFFFDVLHKIFDFGFFRISFIDSQFFSFLKKACHCSSLFSCVLKTQK